MKAKIRWQRYPRNTKINYKPEAVIHSVVSATLQGGRYDTLTLKALN